MNASDPPRLFTAPAKVPEVFDLAWKLRGGSHHSAELDLES
jgi:hypothetical protein